MHSRYNQHVLNALTRSERVEIASLRAQYGVTQDAIARLAGVDRSSVSRVLSGRGVSRPILVATWRALVAAGWKPPGPGQRPSWYRVPRRSRP